MKKTSRKHLLRTIKKSKVTFFAVAFIAAVSIAIFVGFQSASMAILHRADTYFHENNLQTLEIACANGITEEDLTAIAAWEGVTAVEGGYTAPLQLKYGGQRLPVQGRSLLNSMNVPEVVEGVLPAAANEVAVEELMAMRKGVQVGDTVTLEHEGQLVEDTFTVTAIIREPAYCCVNVKDSRGKGQVGLGSNDFYVELLPEAFDPDYFSDCYTTAYVDSTVLDGIFYFSEDYYSAEKAYIDRLDAAAQDRAKTRYDSLMADVQQQLDEAQADIDSAQKELDDAKSKVSDGEKELADGKAQLANSQQELQDAAAAIDAQLTALSLGTDYDAALGALTAFGPAGQPLADAILQYKMGQIQLDTARADLVKAETELDDARKDIAEGETELADARKEFAEAEADAADIRHETWVVSGRNDMGDVRGVQTIVDMLTGLSYAMSVVFLLVAVIICYASATRMIDEQRVLIGAQKALGAKPGEILRHYMVYNFLCGILGVILGWILGVVIVENLVLIVFKIEFFLGAIPLQFSVGAALIAGAIGMAIFLVATYVTCRKLVRLPAIELLRGQVETQGKRWFFESWGVYQKCSLYTRTMIKNAISDKGRMLTTIMGVVGCTSLLVSCMSLKMGIEASSVRHFEDYFLYEYRLVVDTTTGETDDFAAALTGQGVDFTLIHDKLENFRPLGGSWDNAHVVAVNDREQLADFMVLEDVDAKAVISVPSQGLLVSRRCAERFDLEAGSTVELMDSKGNPIALPIAGVIEHYLPYHLFVADAAWLESAMGEDTDPSVFLISGDITGLQQKVEGLPGFLSLADNSAFDANADVHTLVIAICTALSAAMALLVLLNQITMHINRKARELAVMRINGYTTSQTKAYVYKDNIILTAIGLILGCAFGIALGYLDIRIIETGACRYVRDPNLTACLISSGIVALFAVVVNVMALRRIEKLNLTNVSSN